MITNVDFIQDFVQESKEHIMTFEKGLLDLDVDNPVPEIINDIFRAIHSIKGTAGFFNLTQIVQLSHVMENLLGELRASRIKLLPEMIHVLLNAHDTLKVMIDDVLNSDDTEISIHLDAISSFSNKDESNDKILDEHYKKDIVSEVAATSVENKSVPAKEKELLENEPSAQNKKANNIHAEDSLRVNVTLLNKLLTLASEMVLGRNQLLRQMENLKTVSPDIDPILQNIDRITTDLQESVMQTRMQPLSKIFSKFPRVIHELSNKLQKEIQLEVFGDSVELDKSIIEGLSDPMIHLIRNAVDHGIEFPEQREAIGKSRVGKIIIRAYNEGGYVNIDITDDGGGIDVEKVKAKAIERNFLSKNDIATMTDRDILKLLFKAGFSTAEKITDVSGRGVGMDVVKSNIDRMGGSIEIFTQLTKGSTFRLLLPLTLAIIPSVIVEVNSQKFALPQVNLQEIVRIGPLDAHKRIECINHAEVIRLRGGLLPIVKLSEVLGIKTTYRDDATGESKPENRTTIFGVNPDFPRKPRVLKEAVKILVIRVGSKKAGIVVDAIHGSEEILVKQMPSIIKNSICYSGVTIMGDGKVAMILDPQGLIEKAMLKYPEKPNEEITNTNVEDNSLVEEQSLILFKCSGDEIFAVDLSLVSRVEKIKVDEISNVGEKEYIKYRGDAIRVIRFEDFMPISRKPISGTFKYVIIPKYIKTPIGILVEEIIDTINSTIKINHDDIQSEGIMGSTIINNKIVLLPDIFRIFEKVHPEHFKTEKAKNISGEINILLAEDTPFFLKIEQNYFQNAGYKVHTAINGKEALDILLKHKIDALVSDIQMPIMDGLELIRKIRANDTLKNLPAIAVTSLTGERHVKEILGAGFDLYENKLDKTTLLKVLKGLLDERGIYT